MEPTGSVLGLSSLRAAEDKGKVVHKSAKALQMEEYLQKYSANPSDGEKKKKKTKTKKSGKKSRMGSNMMLHDWDIDWQGARERTSDAEENDEPEKYDDDEAPIVENLVEAKHELKMMHRAKNFNQSWNTVQGSPRSHPAKRHDSDDEPPPRKVVRRHDSDDESPPRKASRRHDSDDESSPCNATRRHDSDDESPPRQAGPRHDSGEDDSSPPRRNHPPQTKRSVRPSHCAEPSINNTNNDDEDDDASPPRKPGRRAAYDDDDDDDASPPRRAHADDDASPPRRRDNGRGGAKAFGSKMGDGTSAGIVSGKVMSQEMSAKRAAEKKRILEMTAEQSGRGAEAVHRVDGRVVTKEAFQLAAQQKADAKKRKPKFIEQDVEWKHGLAQQRAAEREADDQHREAGKKFHRTFDDDADAAMKQEIRADDPMAAYVSSRRVDTGAGESLSDRHSELVSSSGFNIPKEMPAHSWVRRKVQPTPNRFKIKPGKHWDGVHRSNGFEDFFFTHTNKSQADKTELYVWAQDV